MVDTSKCVAQDRLRLKVLGDGVIGQIAIRMTQVPLILRRHPNVEKANEQTTATKTRRSFFHTMDRAFK